MIFVRPALFVERKAIHAVAKLSPFTKKWDQVYYLKEYFERQAVAVATSLPRLPSTWTDLDNIIGFIMVHHLIRKPYSSIYYAGSSLPRSGVGSALVRWAWRQTPHMEYRLTVDEENTLAQAFWTKCGFEKYGEKKVKDGHTVFEMKCSHQRARERGLV